jgi:two-component system phosphate regulon sensor histidine kinase PhoR/two-component system sensor histidine kinase VicK
MIPILKPLMRSVWMYISLLAFGCSLLSIVIVLVLQNILSLNYIISSVFCASIILCIAVTLSYFVAQKSIKSTDYLAKAILLVTRDNNQLQAPDPDLLKASSDFLTKLAKDIYELASRSSHSDQNAEYRLTFYKTLTDNIALPIIGLDKERQLCFVNNAALSYINKTSDDVMGKQFYDVFNLSFVSEYTLESWLDKCQGKTISDTEVWSRVRLQSGQESRKQFDLVAKFSSENSFGLETVLVMFDRTLQYERDDHDLTYVSLAVHELRAPLTIMRGYIEVFEDEIGYKLNNEQIDFMNNLIASSQQLTSFVSNILNVARIEESELVLRLQEENWPEALKSACKDMELRASVHNKNIVYDISSDLPTVAVDKVSIYEVMSNLLDNAIKYTHTDGDIVVKSYLKDGMIETTVSDKGVGISDAIISHIFDKFYRAHKSKNSIGGTGLGLYLCRAIINAHGGTIWVKSKEGEGTTFGFSLPIYASVAEQLKNEDNGSIIRGAHGWIKNHSLYRE